MDKPRECKRSGPDGTPGGILCLENQNLQSSPRQKDRGRQPVGPGAYDNGIMRGGSHGSIAPLPGAAHRATPRLESLENDRDTPSRQPYTEGAKSQHKMERMVNSRPAKDPRAPARSTDHGAVFIRVPRNGERVPGIPRIPVQGRAHRFVVHRGNCREKCGPWKATCACRTRIADQPLIRPKPAHIAPPQCRKRPGPWV